MYGYVYETTNLINDKKYIGQKKSNKVVKSYLGSGIAIKNAIKKYGKENFIVKIIEIINTNQKDLNDREAYWINFYNAVHSDKYYNLINNAQADISDETRKRMSAVMKLRYKEHPESWNRDKWNDERKAKFSKRRKELHLKHSEETKLKIGKAHQGKTINYKNKLSEANKRFFTNEENRKRWSEISKNNYNNLPIETKIRLAKMHKDTNIGRIWVHRDNESKFIKSSELDTYLLQGFIKGRPQMLKDKISHTLKSISSTTIES